MSWTKHAKHTLGLLAACAAWGPYGGALGHAEPPEQDPPGMREAQQDPADAQPEYVPGELLVKFVDEAPDAAIVIAAQVVAGAEELKAFPPIGVQLWRLGPGVTVEQALEVLSWAAFADAVDFAEPNYIVHAFDVPNDPRFGEQWALHNTGQTGGTPGADIAAPDAWGIQTGSPSIVVGVIDTGIDYDHEDLAANIWINPGEIAGNGIDDDGNGFIDDVRGWDFVKDDNDPMDDNNHGTHTSGTVGAVGNNGIGVVGVNWTVTLMPLKFLNRQGRGTTADAIAAILYAASFEDGFGNKIVRITNNSWGGGSPSEALETAIAGSGALFVAAAGNSGRTTKMYPAGFDSDNIISVAATDHNDELAGFSNFSTSWVDLGAPGVDVLSTVRRNKYRLFSGTSMAAPHVAGVAGLVMAQFPGLSNETVKARILATVDPLLSLEGKTLTGGRLNALNAVGNPDLIPPDPVILAVDLAATTFDSIKLTWTATGDDGTSGTATLYDVRYSTSPISNDADFDGATQAEGEPPPQPSGSSESFTVTGLSGDTTYFLALKVADEVGNVSALSNVVSETTPPTPPGEWSIEIVDSGSGTFIGEVALAYDPIGNPAIAYRDSTNDQVKFAHFNGSSWDVETVAAGRSVDLAYDPLTGEPTISYRLGPDASVMFARFDGFSWDIQLVTDKSSRLGMETSLAYDSIGNPSISHHKSHGQGRGLKLARFNDLTQQWDIEVLGPGIHVPFNSLAYGQDGNPSIAYIYHHTHPGVLKIARFNGASWDIEIVDSRDPYRGVSLAYDPVSGDPAIAYNIRGEENVRIPTFARWNGTTWEIEAVDSVGSETSLAYDSSGVPFISIKASTQIKVAQRIGTVWEIEIVENVAVAGQTSLAFDQLGNPSVSYYDTDNDVLKFARKLGP